MKTTCKMPSEFFFLSFSYIKTMGESQCKDTGLTSGLIWSLPGTLGKFASTWIMLEESDQRKKYRVSEPGISWVSMSKIQCPEQFSFLVHVAFCVSLLFQKVVKMERHMLSVTKVVNYHHIFKMELSSSLEFRFHLGIHWSLESFKSLVVKYFMSFTLSKDIF